MPPSQPGSLDRASDPASNDARLPLVHVLSPDDTELVHPTSPARDAFISENIRSERMELTGPAEADFVILFENWSYKTAGYSQVLEDSPIVRQYFRKLLVVNHDDHGRGFLPGCYTSLTSRNFDRRLHRSCAYPNTYNDKLESRFDEHGSRPPRNLYSFSGTLASSPVRRRLHAILRDDRDGTFTAVDKAFRSHTNADKIAYADQILDSQFALCPRGWSASTYRLYEAMQLGRCPVIISDDWVPADLVDWPACSIRLRESDISRLPAILRARRAEAAALGAQARHVWRQYFSPGARERTLLTLLLELEGTMTRPRSMDELSARWKSFRFQHANGWAPQQRAMRLIRRTLGLHAHNT